MGNSRHAHSNSVVGWAVWLIVMAFVWALAFVFGEVIPSFGDFLSLLSAAFDSFFGAMFWAGCWFSLHRGNYFSNLKQKIGFFVNVVIFGLGLFMLGPGLCASRLAGAQADVHRHVYRSHQARLQRRDPPGLLVPRVRPARWTV